MSFKSKIDWPVMAPILPTRHREAQGHSVESRMLLKTPANEIRTQLRNNPDGSITMLRTRGGFPEFTTISPPVVVVPTGYIEESYNLRAYFEAATMFTYFMQTTPLLENKRLTLQALPNVLAPNQTYYYNVLTPVPMSDGMGLLRYLRKPKLTNIHFNSDNSDNATVFAETGQTYFEREHTVKAWAEYVIRVSPIKTAPMTILGKSETLLFKEPPTEITTGGITSFDNVVTWGLPWHGQYSGATLTLPNGTILPTVSSGGGFLTPDLPNNTTYLDFGMPAAPAPTAEEVAAGMVWMKDVLLCGTDKVWAGAGRRLGADTWIYRSPDGSIHYLKVLFTTAGATGISLYLYEEFNANAYYYFTKLSCPDYYADFVATAPYDGSIETYAESLTGYSILDPCRLRQSPDGKKCCVMNGTMRTAVEFTASGGDNDGVLTITYRFVNELAPVWISSHTGSTTKPPYPASSEATPAGWTYEYWTDHRAPVGINYTKDGVLYVETARCQVHVRNVCELGEYPILYVETSDYWRTVTFSTYLGESSETRTVLNGKASRIRDTVSGYQNGTWGDWIIFGPSGTWQPKAPYAALYATYGGNNNIDPLFYAGDTTGPQVPAYPRRSSNILTILVRQDVSVSNRWVIEAAYAYGQSVAALVGHEFSTGYPWNIALNPRNGSVAFGADAGWA